MNRKFEQWAVRRAMVKIGMSEYPEVVGDPDGTRCSGLCVCEKCGFCYYDHPLDWRMVEHDGRAWLNILCDGRRVKL